MVTRERVPNVKAVNDVLLPLANHGYYNDKNDPEDVDALAAFIADHVSLRAGREGTSAQKQARSRLIQNMRRNKLQLTLREGKSRKAIERASDSD